MAGYSDYLASVSMSLSKEKFAQYNDETEIQNELSRIKVSIPNIKENKIDLLALRKKMLSPDLVCLVSKRSEYSVKDFKRNVQFLFELGLEYAKAIENNNSQRHRLVMVDFVSESQFPLEIREYIQDESAMRSTLVRGFSTFNYVGFPILAELSSGNVFYFEKKPMLGRHLYSIGMKYAKEYFRP